MCLHKCMAAAPTKSQPAVASKNMPATERADVVVTPKKRFSERVQLGTRLWNSYTPHPYVYPAVHPFIPPSNHHPPVHAFIQTSTHPTPRPYGSVPLVGRLSP